jgi:hypothetical protein
MRFPTSAARGLGLAALILAPFPWGPLTVSAEPGQFLQELEQRPTRFGILAFGTTVTPQTGPLGLVGTLYLGQAPEVQAWVLQSPWADRRIRGWIGTSTLVGLGEGPAGLRALTELAALQVGDHLDCWRLINTDEVRRLPVGMLGWITDETPNNPDNDLETEALYRVLLQASQTSAAAFVKAARPDLTYNHLFTQPKKHRGEVVRVEGRLKGVRRQDPPQLLRDAGVRDVFEGMIAADAYGAKRFYVMFTELPPSVPLQDRLDLPVSFAGYFFKKYRYAQVKDHQPEQLQFAPLLIGRTIRAQPDLGEEDESAWVGPLLPWVVGIMLGAAGLVLALILWFRRSDQRVRRRLEALRGSRFVEPAPDPVPLARPIGQESGVRGQESGIRDQESGVRDQGSGVRNQESGIWDQE